jgi:hypothetical protein
MELYEKFIKTNPRDNNRFKSFLNNNCSRIPILENLRAQGLPDDIARTECNSCNLCKKSIFEKKRSDIKKIIKDLKETPIFLLPEKLNGLSDKYLNIRLRVFETTNRDYDAITNYYDNLYQHIFYSLIFHFVQKLNEVGADNIYFSQIAEILISTKAFISDIKRIRDEYLEEQTTNQIDFDFYRKHNISKMTIYKEIVKIRERHNLTQRWEPWIEKMLYYDFESNKKIVFMYLPSGRILREKKLVRVNGRTGIVDVPIIAGDETMRQIEDFQDTYNVRINLEQPLKKRRPILEFEKYLRWYKAREEGLSYIDIFDRELDDHDEDWREFSEYRNTREDDSIIVLSDGRTREHIERQAINRIKYGVNKLRRKIFKEDK